MKYKLHYLILVIVLALFQGCKNADFSVPPGTTIGISTDGNANINGSVGIPISTNATLVLTGGTNVTTGDWSGGISIEFKNPPPPSVTQKLLAAGAVSAKGNSVWSIPRADVTNKAVLEAVIAAYEQGATIKPLKK